MNTNGNGHDDSIEPRQPQLRLPPMREFVVQRYNPAYDSEDPGGEKVIEEVVIIAQLLKLYKNGTARFMILRVCPDAPNGVQDYTVKVFREYIDIEEIIPAEKASSLIH